MNLDVISRILIEAGCAQALGVDLFQHHMPETVTSGVLLKLPIAGIPVNHYIPGYFKGSFQTIVRAPQDSVGEPVAKKIWKALTIYEQTYNDPDTGEFQMLIHHLFPRDLPVRYPRSIGNLIEWAITFDCNYVLAI